MRLGYTFASLLAGLVCLSCGSGDGVEASFRGRKACDPFFAWGCSCVAMNSKEHALATGLTILKCPGDENYEAAKENPGCLNRDPESGQMRLKLSKDGCPFLTGDKSVTSEIT